MAGFDGNGPRGTGPMTGKGMGYCAADVSERPYYGRGMGLGMGRGIARRRPGIGRGIGRRGLGRYSVEDAEYLFDSKISLEDEKTILEERLNKINSQLKKD